MTQYFATETIDVKIDFCVKLCLRHMWLIQVGEEYSVNNCKLYGNRFKVDILWLLDG